MSQALQRLLNKPLHSRIATLFHHQQPFQFPSPPAGALSNSRFTPTLYPNSNPSPISKTDDKTTSFNGFQEYPSFSFGYFLNPISSSGLPLSEIVEAQEVALDGDESRMRFTPTLYPNSNPSPISKTDDKTISFNGFQVYPSFSFGYFLNPISSSGLPLSEIVEAQEVAVDGDESRMIWADSVKKKRKKKMNKHKLKKLRKRLRHCS